MADGHGSNRGARDPFAGLDARACAEVLKHKGWPARVEGADLVVDLGEVVALVATGRVGLQTLERLAGAHGELPEAPAHRVQGGEEMRLVRYFRAPPGGVPSATNLHGVAPGVSLRAAGCSEKIPPSIEQQVLLRWIASSHPATTPLVDLPRWVAEMARDPASAAKAWDYVRPSADATRALDAWEKDLVRVRGRTVNTFGNVMKIFRGAPCYAGRFRLNRMTQAVEFENKALPEGRIGTFREQVEDAPWGSFAPSEASVMQAVRSLAEEQAYHPVQDYLRGLRWDGVERLAYVARGLLGAEGELAATMVRRWFVSAVARALRPGCQVDTALVLVGPQGWRKSSFFRALAGEWFADTEVRIGDKDGYQQIHAAWITEWGEIDRVTGARHAGEVKAFVSRREDLFRPPYGRTTANFPMSCVIVGSTNDDQFLTDPTGSRRFWCLRVATPIDASAVARDRDQLWAEAVAALEAGEPWWLSADEDREREQFAEEHAVEDPWLAPLEQWLRGLDRDEVTAAEALCEMGLPRKEQTKTNCARAGHLLRVLGLNRRKHRPLRNGSRGAPTWCWFRPDAWAPTEEGSDEMPS